MADTCAAESVNTCLPPVGSPFMKSALLSHVVLPALCLTPLATLVLFPLLWRALGSFLGWYLRKKTDGRRCHILEVVEADEKKYQEERASEVSRGEAGEDVGWEKVDAHALGTAQNGGKGGDDENWAGVVGFFHPFCNAGGGGERVLWAAIRATQQRWPKAKCVVYTGDHDVSKDAMLARNRFNIHLHPPTINFLYLTTRHWVLASTWPHFTLAGQSFGSLILAWDAFSLLVPDIFVDTMGYAFALGLSKFLFRDVPTGAYVHYPTISTDMLDSLDPASAVGSQGVNASQGVGVRGGVKKLYWRLFARAYSRAGASADVVMTNSSWTQAHIQKLWGPLRQRSPNNSRLHPIAVVYPPVAVRELEHEVEVSPASEARREKVLLYIAQFRPEKNHALILQAFAHFLKQQNNNTTTATGSDNSNSSNNNNNNNNGGGPRLVLVGSVRDDSDSKRVYQLRLLANELGVRGRVEFHLDASWPEILDWLRRASVGVNGMWNEHFGIGVVEYQAAGLVAVVHDSGGPRMDIVVDVEGGATGFHATTAAEFAQAFDKALNLPDPYAVRRRARQSAKRFTEEEFARRWIEQMEKLVAARVGKKTV
ncbi:209976c6-8333-49c0-b0dd-da98f7f609e3 [Thermothielavioides terrestris]|uniref:GDP-Man:Man(3)GlcNAc(2)-PP-Dol alpha-1,2-mannosyltransferase n=1 Tax=Thermothielavioides terrestris TaxID=2587410 RepID=A0A3S4BRJ5_9PEZI|nr:209976c6-8333-49c0-b0dd-da98f7f609e3 [Thermothielavioides terrestris]